MDYLKIYQSTLFFSTRPTLRITSQPEPNLLKYYQSLPDLGKGKYPTPVSAGLPCERREILNFGAL